MQRPRHARALPRRTLAPASAGARRPAAPPGLALTIIACYQGPCPHTTAYDAVIVGGGHNGLVAAAYLARAGRSVLVLERLGHTGGAAVSTRPFAGVDARLSRYSYLVTLLPRKIVRDLGLRFAVRKRTVSSYTPAVRDGRPTGLLVGGGERRTRESFAAAHRLGPRVRRPGSASTAMTRQVAERVFPTLTEPLPTRAELRARIDDDGRPGGCCSRSRSVSASRRHFADDLVRGVVLTDALIGTFADAHDPSLRQNRCFLYHVIGGGTGDWDVPVGGMGALTDALARGGPRRRAPEIVTGHEVTAIETDGRAPRSPTAPTPTASSVVAARHVLVNASPQALAALLGDEPPAARRGRPAQGQHAAAPAAAAAGHAPSTRARRSPAPSISPRGTGSWPTAYRQAASGGLPAAPPSEIYCHSLTDPSILGPDLAAQGYQTLTLFGLHTPARLFARGQRRRHATRC